MRTDYDEKDPFFKGCVLKKEHIEKLMIQYDQEVQRQKDLKVQRDTEVIKLKESMATHEAKRAALKKIADIHKDM